MFLFWVGYYQKFYNIYILYNYGFLLKMNLAILQKNLEYLLNKNNLHDKYLVLCA